MEPDDWILQILWYLFLVDFCVHFNNGDRLAPNGAALKCFFFPVCCCTSQFEGRVADDNDNDNDNDNNNNFI